MPSSTAAIAATPTKLLLPLTVAWKRDPNEPTDVREFAFMTTQANHGCVSHCALVVQKNNRLSLSRNELKIDF